MGLDFYSKSGFNYLANFIKMFVFFTKSMSFPGSCKRIFDQFPIFTCLMFPQVCTFCIFRSTTTEWPCFPPSHICCILLSCGPGKCEFDLETHSALCLQVLRVPLNDFQCLCPQSLLGDSGGVVNSLDFSPAVLKSLGCFCFRCILSSQWKAVTVNLRILRCQL